MTVRIGSLEITIEPHRLGWWRTFAYPYKLRVVKR
jgi:hypothetical protein